MTVASNEKTKATNSECSSFSELKSDAILSLEYSYLKVEMIH